MNSLYDYVERVMGSKPVDDEELYDRLGVMAYEGSLVDITEGELRKIIPRIAMSRIVAECGGKLIKTNDGLCYRNELLEGDILESDIENGRYLSDETLTEFEWYDYYYDAVDVIVSHVRKKSIFT